MRRSVLVKLVIMLCCLVLIIGAILIIESQNDHETEQQRGVMSEDFGQLARREYNGKVYVEKPELTSILMIGVDRDQDVETTGFRNGGQADFIMLTVLDHQNKEIRRLQIDRDTITDVVMLSILGRQVGTRKTHICLSHGFGENEEERCGYTCEAVQNLLLGQKIDLYVCMHFDAIGVFNDFLGGVTVPIEDDFSSIDATMVKGTTMKLNAQQAMYYVRGRYGIGAETNESRMVRQKAYMVAAVEQLQQMTRQDSTVITRMYNAMGDNMITDMSNGRLLNEFNRAYSYEVMPVEYLKGEYKLGDDGFMEFHADEQFIADWVLSVFYEQP